MVFDVARDSKKTTQGASVRATDTTHSKSTEKIATFKTLIHFWRCVSNSYNDE